MKWNLLKVNASVLIGLSALGTDVSAFTGPMFNISRTGNEISIGSNIIGRQYPKAGFFINSSHYTVSPTRSNCTLLPSGFCLFPLNNTTKKTIVLQRKGVLSTVMGESINLLTTGETGTVCLNGEGQLSCQRVNLSTAPAPAPGKIVGYLEGYNSSPPSASSIAAAGYTHVIIGFGVFSTTTPGGIVSTLVSPVNQQSYMDDLHAAGLKVLLSIGGASVDTTTYPNTTVDFDDAINVASSPQAFEDSFMGSMDYFRTLGFDGFDFDIEHGLIPSGTFTAPTGDIAVLADIINTYHAQNPDVLLTLAPQIANISATGSFNETFGNYSSLVMQTYSSLTWVGIQLYNSGCAFGIDTICYDPNTSTFSPDPAVAFATDLLANWPATLPTGQATGFQSYISYLLPSQVLLGYPVDNNSGQSDGSPAAVISVIKRAIQCLNTKEFGSTSCETYAAPSYVPYGIGGVFSWNLNYDATTNFSFATSLYSCVVNGVCT